MLSFDRSAHGNVLIIEAGGQLEGDAAKRLGSTLRDEIESGARSIVLDFDRVDGVDDDGLWELMTALKRIRRRDGDLCLARPSDPVREALAISALDQIFRMYETQADAVASF